MRPNPITSASRLGLLCFVVVVTLSCTAISQNCTVTGDFTMRQANGITVNLTLLQKGENVTGSASFQGRKQGHGHIEMGSVSGVFIREGKHSVALRMEIKWEYGETGVYRGYLQNRAVNGKYTTAQVIKGDAYIKEDATNRDRRTNWAILEDIPCNSR